MDTNAKTILRVIGWVIAVIIGVKLTLWVLGLAMALVFKVLVPLAIIGAIGYVIYRSAGGRSLPGINRKILR